VLPVELTKLLLIVDDLRNSGVVLFMLAFLYRLCAAIDDIVPDETLRVTPRLTRERCCYIYL